MHPRHLQFAMAAALAGLFALAPGPPLDAAHVDRLLLVRDGRSIRLEGRVMVEAADGGLLVLDESGELWAVQPEELEQRTPLERSFAPLTRRELAGRLLEELPQGFRIHETTRYLICYNTSPAYAEWCGALFERLYLGFATYWNNQGFPVHEPELPLVAVVFSDQQSYADHTRAELGDATSAIIGYYSLTTNRVNMYDLTGVEGLAANQARVTTAQHINRVLSQPQAERMVATIIHEATHQLAFNCGLQQRFADIPLWVSEGVATYFESPDLRSSRGWRGIGGVNHVRLAEFRRYLRNRPPDSLQTLVVDDQRFRHSRTAGDAYAEAWALNYFLLRTRSDRYLRYLEQLSQKQPLVKDPPARRIAEFEEAFGQSIQQLDGEFLRYMSRVR